jgi:putative oxidoreductase
MNVASTICRYLLGIIFTVFGLNGFLHFIPLPPPTGALALQFMISGAVSHFFVLIFLVQLVGGILLLAGRFVPLALVALAGVLINVLDYHLTMDPAGIGAGVLATVLWFVTAWQYRASLRGIFVSNAEPAAVKAAREFASA